MKIQPVGISDRFEQYNEKEQILEGVSAHMIESAYGGLMNYNELIAWVEEVTALLRPSTYSSSEQVDGRLLLHFLRLKILRIRMIL